MQIAIFRYYECNIYIVNLLSVASFWNLGPGAYRSVNVAVRKVTIPLL